MRNFIFCTLLKLYVNACWQEGEVPQDMRDAKVITLYKNKGERTDCNSYIGSFLLSIVGKITLCSFDYNNLQNLYIRNHSVDFVQADQQLI